MKRPPLEWDFDFMKGRNRPLEGEFASKGNDSEENEQVRGSPSYLPRWLVRLTTVKHFCEEYATISPRTGKSILPSRCE